MRDNLERDLFIDTLRVASVLIVVFGHWLTTTVIWEPGRIDVENALSVVSQTHLATWLIQVMPLMFFVGGFANSRSLDLHDGGFLAYLRTRYERLLLPTMVFIFVWLVAGLAAEMVSLPEPNVVDRAADQAALPFWFLGLYLIVVALAPTMGRLHASFGWVVPAVLAAGAVVIDLLHHGFDVPHVGGLNYVFVWLLAHQLGFFYADGSLQRLPRRLLAGMVLAGLAGIVLLTSVADYPVSMVGVPGDERWNTNPPSLALVMLTLWLVGLALLLRPAVLPTLATGEWSNRIAPLNSVILTVFLWHVSAISLTASIIYPLGFPRPETGTAAWWALRPVWLLALLPVLVALVATFRRFEVHPGPREFTSAGAHTTRHVGAGLGVVSLGLGILGFGVTGFDRIASALGEDVLGFETNPLQNVLHLVLGLTLLMAVYGTAGRARLATTMIAVTYLAIGLVGRSSGIEVLGMNPATGVLHIVVGGVALALLGWALWTDRSPVKN